MSIQKDRWFSSYPYGAEAIDAPPAFSEKKIHSHTSTSRYYPTHPYLFHPIDNHDEKDPTRLITRSLY
jgi:hypothetical protein